MRFLILFVLIPVIELYTMLSVAEEVGAFSTVMLVLLTAIIGGYLVRYQGMSVLLRSQAAIARGEQPTIEMLEGAILLICGLMLLLPGFITDSIGFLLLIPPLRQKLITFFLGKSIVTNANATVQQPNIHQETRTQGSIIESTSSRED